MESSYLNHIDLSVTKEVEEFVKNTVFANEYLFYGGKGKEQTAYCTMCDTEFDSYRLGLKHNAEGICPICGADTQAKNIRYGRKKCTKQACFYYFEKSKINEEVLICKGYYVSKEYHSSYKKPKINYELQAVYVFGEGKATMYKNEWYSGFNKRASIFDFNTGWLANFMCYCSFESLYKSIKGTKYQYFDFEKYAGKESIVKIIELYDKYQFIEQLSKVGMESIVYSMIRRNDLYRCINYRGKDLFKILRIKKADLKAIRESKVYVTPLFLRLYQIQLKDKSLLTPEEVKEVERSYGHCFYVLEKMLRHSSMKKIDRYIDKQQQKYKRNELKSGILIMYKDYIEGCEKLGLDLKSKDVLYPSNIFKSHDDVITQIKVKENKGLDKKIQGRLGELLDKYLFEKDGLIIVPASSTLELIQEGKELKHCVATNYSKTYAEGRTIILLVRRIEEIDKPFVTVEVNRGKVIQCRAKRNKTAPEEVLSFMEEFKKEKLNVKAIAA